MKEGITLVLVVLALVTTTGIFGHKIHEEQDGMDKTEIALTGAKKYVNLVSTIAYQSIGAKNEMRFWVKYILTPCSITTGSITTDTVLTVCTAVLQDSVATAMEHNRKILWKNKDEQYAYLLSCNP